MTYYSILGVTPDAEDIVITAAYRALAQRYHPDKWPGDLAEAQRRMAKINEAYSVLRDPTKRNEYDRTQKDTSEYFDSEESKDTDEAFSAALFEVEERWSIACNIFPDLNLYRKNLQKISTPLAFSYVMYLLECKLFNSRKEVYENMELRFLERYFGSNYNIIKFAKELIQNGRKDEAKKLNQLVDVMGENIDPHLIIANVKKNYKDNSLSLIQVFKNNPIYENVRKLVEYNNYKIHERDKGFMNPRTEITMISLSNDTLIFDDKYDFVKYVKDNFEKFNY